MWPCEGEVTCPSFQPAVTLWGSTLHDISVGDHDFNNIEELTDPIGGSTFSTVSCTDNSKYVQELLSMLIARADRRPIQSRQLPQCSRYFPKAIAVGQHMCSSHRLCCVVELSRRSVRKPTSLLTSPCCCGDATAADGCAAFVYIEHICRSGTPRLPGCHGNWLSNMTAISRRNRRVALAPRVHS